MSPPLMSVAVDHAEPFNLRTSPTKKSTFVKCYVALFKCMCSGSTHLEAVTKLSTAGFIIAFNCFILRHGLSIDI